MAKIKVQGCYGHYLKIQEGVWAFFLGIKVKSNIELQWLVRNKLTQCKHGHASSMQRNIEIWDIMVNKMPELKGLNKKRQLSLKDG